jgi:hypothetical protein
MIDKKIISWLLDGDVSVQYQVYRDLLNVDKPMLRERIELEGWGAKFLSCRNQEGHWGRRFYQPKWTSTHYTLLDLKNLNISPCNQAIRKILETIFESEKGPDGGIGAFGTSKKCDVCVNGMILNYAAYFTVDEEYLKSIVDFLLTEKMKDGGFNCLSNKSGAIHSSLHSTLSVLEGILEYERNGYKYKLSELLKAKSQSHEFILMHRLFRSDKTGEIINPNFLKFHYPTRWYYDILKALDYFQSAKTKYDDRMSEAIDIMWTRRTKDGLWKLASQHPGQTHFDMERVGQPSRWNTLRASRILKHFQIHENSKG